MLSQSTNRLCYPAVIYAPTAARLGKQRTINVVGLQVYKLLLDLCLDSLGARIYRTAPYLTNEKQIWPKGEGAKACVVSVWCVCDEYVVWCVCVCVCVCV